MIRFAIDRLVWGARPNAPRRRAACRWSGLDPRRDDIGGYVGFRRSGLLRPKSTRAIYLRAQAGGKQSTEELLCSASCRALFSRTDMLPIACHVAEGACAFSWLWYGVHQLNITAEVDRELTILEKIYRSSRSASSSVRQRDLARVAGISLGMTNSIVKRLARKGWLVIRRVNSRNIQYAVSPSGVREIARRSYRFLRRTLRDIADYKETLEEFAREIGRRGYTGVVLEGTSDLDFVVEHVCTTVGLSFARIGEAGRQEPQEPPARSVDAALFRLVGEGARRFPEGTYLSPEEGRAFLGDILIGW